MEDILFWSNVAASFVGGLLNVDPAAVLAAGCTVAGMILGPVARLTGRTVAASYRGVRWCLTTPPLSTEAQAILAKIDGACSLSEAGNVRAGSVVVDANGNAYIVKEKESLLLNDVLTRRERRLIGKKARVVLARLKVEAEAKRRADVLAALCGTTTRASKVLYAGEQS